MLGTLPPTNKALAEQSGRTPPKSSADRRFVAGPLLSVSVLSSAPYLVVRCLRGLLHMPSWGGEGAAPLPHAPFSQWPVPAPSPACCSEEPNRFPWNLLPRLSDEAPSGLHYGLRRKLRAGTRSWPPAPVCRKASALQGPSSFSPHLPISLENRHKMCPEEGGPENAGPDLCRALFETCSSHQLFLLQRV